MPNATTDPLLLLLAAALCGALLGGLIVHLAGAGRRGRLAAEAARAGELERARARLEEEAKAGAIEAARLGEALAAEARRADERARALAGREAQVEELSAAYKSLELAHEGLRADARGQERRIEELKAAREEMQRIFAESAGALMQKHGETFKAQNREQVEMLLTPLRGQIEAFQKSLGAAHLQSVEQQGMLKAQIEQLSQRSAAMSRETENLTRALKGDVQVQGGWGEMILETILQRLGFREGQEYSRQETHADESGGRSRTDYIVNLPNGDRLIIDSKVSLKAFEAASRAETDTERRAARRAHADSMRAHIKGLGGKAYHNKAGSRLDFVIMFVPIEAALGEALGEDEELILLAADAKVAIATPATLTTQLKTVAAIWRVELQNRNAEDIANRAGQLYDKFAGFIDDMQEIGTRLGRVDAAYQSAFRRLSTGQGNLLRQVEMLKELGARADRSLPKDLLEGASDGDALSLPGAVEGPDAAPPQRAAE